MSDEKLIADQAREIAHLKEQLSGFKESNAEIRNVLFCIGGPLNDNNLGFTKEQLRPFFRISNLLVSNGGKSCAYQA